jgi:hypothetical protein
MKKIEITELQLVFSRIIEKLKLNEPSGTIEIEEDLYQFIPADKWHGFDQDHSLTGSLYDDLDSLTRLAHENPDVDSADYYPTTFVDFDRLAFVLMAISQKYNPPGH